MAIKHNEINNSRLEVFLCQHLKSFSDVEGAADGILKPFLLYVA